LALVKSPNFHRATGAVAQAAFESRILKAVYHILVSGAETIGFNMGFDTVNLHRCVQEVPS